MFRLPIHTLALRAADHGGFTYRLSDGTFPTSGFAVAVSKGPEVQLDHCPLPSDIEAFVADHADIIAAGNIVFNGGVCVGAWNGGDRWYLDLSIVVSTEHEAMDIARRADQRAVYDLANSRPVAVTWPGLDHAVGS